MENFAWKVYEKLDDKMMYLADKAVRVYNWTTGRSKYDLSNKLLTIAPILESVGSLNTGDYHLAIPYSAMMIYHSHIHQLENKDDEKRESKIKDRNILDYNMETHKKLAKVFGPVWTGLGGGLILSSCREINTTKSELGYASLAIGQFLRGMALYTIRVDSLPPRKNVLSRAKDKLIEMFNKPIVPEPIPVKYQSLEELID